jgi:hypothetical protein
VILIKLFGGIVFLFGAAEVAATVGPILGPVVNAAALGILGWYYFRSIRGWGRSWGLSRSYTACAHEGYDLAWQHCGRCLNRGYY